MLVYSHARITRIPMMAAVNARKNGDHAARLWRGGSQKIDHRQMPNAPAKAKKGRGTKW